MPNVHGKFLGASLALLFFATALAAQIPRGSQGLHTPVPRDTSLGYFGYYEYLPQNYDSKPSTNWPLMIFLPGLGEKGNGTTELYKVMNPVGPAKHVSQGSNFPFILITPQSHHDGWWDANNVHKLVTFLLTNYRVNRDRVYLTGLSAGGIGTWEYTAAHPEIIAAAVPIAGNGNNIVDVCAMRNEPIWAFHGDADPTVSVYGSINPTAALKNCNPAPNPVPKLTLYAGVGHDSWTRTYSGSGMGTARADSDPFNMSVYSWMLQQRNFTSFIKIAGVSANPSVMSNNVSRVLVVNATVTETNGGSISSVRLDLSALGGTNALVMTHLGGGNYTASFPVPIGISGGVKNINLTAYDNGTGYKNRQIQVTMVHVNTGITLSGFTVNPITVPSHIATTVNFSLDATDSNGTISSVLLDLRPLGGNSNAPMNLVSGSTYSSSFLTAVGILPGLKTIRALVRDNANNIRSTNLSMIVEGGVFPTGVTASVRALGTNQVSWNNNSAGNNTIYCSTTGPISDANLGSAVVLVADYPKGNTTYTHALSDHVATAQINDTPFYYAVASRLGGKWLHITNANQSGRYIYFHYDAAHTKKNVVLDGNNKLEFHVKNVAGALNWTKIQIYVKANYLANYTHNIAEYATVGSNWTTISIPLTAFSNIDAARWLNTEFVALRVDSGSGTGSFGIDEIKFTGGLTPFVWYGDEYTNSASVGVVEETISSFSIKNRPVVGGFGGGFSPVVVGLNSTLSSVNNHIPIPEESGIQIASFSASPNFITNNIGRTVVFNASASDSNGTVSTVLLNLSGLGGSASQSMSSLGGGNYTYTMNVASGVSVGIKNITITVTDNEGHNETGMATVQVFPPYVLPGPTVGIPLVATNMSLSKGKPIYSDKADANIGNLNDGWDKTWWTFTGPAWIAMKIDATNCDADFLLINQRIASGLWSRPDNDPTESMVNFDIFTSMDSTDGNNGTWTFIKTVTNKLCDFVVTIPNNQPRWIKFHEKSSKPINLARLEVFRSAPPGYRNDYWIFFGASDMQILHSPKNSGPYDVFSDMVRTGNPKYYPIIVNLSHSGEKVEDGVKRLTNQAVPNNPHATFLGFHHSGNNISEARPYPGQKDIIARGWTNLVKLAKSNGLVPIPSRITFRHYTTDPIVDYPANPSTEAYGSGPYNFNIIDPLIKSLMPYAFDFSKNLPILDSYTFLSTNEALLSDGVHPGWNGIVKINQYWADAALKIVYQKQNGINLLTRSVTPSVFSNNQSQTLNFMVEAHDNDGAIQSVSLDLSGLGGSSSYSLTPIGNGYYSGSYTVSAGIAVGTKTIPIRAVDNMLNEVLDAVTVVVNHNTPVSGVKKVYILGGQSNMLGQGQLNLLSAAQRAVPANVQFYFDGQLKTFESASYYFGPEVQFAHEISRAYPGEQIVLIKHALGGTTMEYWHPSQTNYKRLVKYITNVTKTLGGSFEFAGILWMQGESDAYGSTTAANYEANLGNFITNIRNDLGDQDLPFIFGLADPMPAPAYVNTVKHAQSNIDVKIANTILVPTDGVARHAPGNEIHYNHLGQMELGHRFFEYSQGLQAGIRAGSVSIVPASVYSNVSTSVQFSINATDSMGTISHVLLNLKEVSGSTNLMMTSMGGGNYQSTFLVPSGLLSGRKNLFFTVVASDGTKRMAGYLDVVANIPGIALSSASVSPSLVPKNSATSVVFSVDALDSNGSITNISLDLSAVGGANRVAMAFQSGNAYSLTYLVPAGLSEGDKNITLTAYDNDGNALSTSLQITVASPPVPTGVAATRLAIGTNLLSWNNDGTGSYKIFCSTNGPITEVNKAQAIVLQTGIPNGTVSYRHPLAANILTAKNNPTPFYYGVSSVRQGGWLQLTNNNQAGCRVLLSYSNGLAHKTGALATGNDRLEMSLKIASGTVNWNNVRVYVKAWYIVDETLSVSAYGTPSGNWLKISIPLTDFTGIESWRWTSGVDQIGLLVVSGSGTGSIGLDEIRFAGGTTPFVWYGDDHTISADAGAVYETTAAFSVKNRFTTGGYGDAESLLSVGVNSTAAPVTNALLPFVSDAAPPDVPTLVAPANNKTNKIAPVNLVWNSVVDNGSSGLQGYRVSIGSFLTNIATTNLTRVFADGIHTWRVAAFDNAGNYSPFSVMRTLVVDTLPPSSVNLVSPASNSILSSTTVTLNWQPSTDATVGIAGYSLEYDDNSGFSSPVKQVLAGTNHSFVATDGSTVFWRVRAFDKAGNTNMASKTWFFTVDTSMIIATPHTPAGAVAISTPVFSWSALAGAGKYHLEVRTNNLAGAVVRTQTNLGSASTNAILLALGDGSYVWQVRAWKSIPGIWQAWSASSSFSVDTKGPVISSIVYPSALLSTNQNSCRLNWAAASDPTGVSTYELTLNGSTVDLGNVTSYQLTALNQGTNRWSIRSRDILGNWGPSTVQRTIVVDSLVPSTPNGLTPANGVVVTNHWPLLDWNPAVDASGIIGYEVQLDGTIYPTAVDSFQPVISLANGAHVWKVRAIDSFGNRSAFSLSNSFALVVDQTGPSAPALISPIAGSTTSDLKPLFTWSRGTDPSGILGYKIVINGVTNLLPASSTNFQPASSLSPGTCQWTVFALDTLGNPGSAQAPVTFTIQSQGDAPPGDNGFSIAPNPFKRSLTDRVVIRFNPEDPSAKIDFTIYTLSGQLVKRLVALPGSNQIEWFGENSQGNNVASGTYFVIMRVNNKSVGKVFKLGVLN